MNLTRPKPRIVPLLLVAITLVLAASQLAPILAALTSTAERLFPDSSVTVVMTNQVLVYRLPPDTASVFSFGIHCFPLSPDLIDEEAQSYTAATGHYGRTLVVLPDPVNNVLLRSNSLVSVVIAGMCYLSLPGGEMRLFQYTISHETFHVGEEGYSSDELAKLLTDYFEGPPFPLQLEDLLGD